MTLTRVVIVQRRLTHYRAPLFERMRLRLAEKRIELSLLHGEGTAEEESKQDGGTLDWAARLPTRYVLDGRLCWQPPGHRIRDADLVVITQENKLLYNHWLLLRRPKARLAYWGHGRNMQSAAPGGWRERLKRWSARRADWWFAYTELSARIVRDAGFPASRITVLDNAVDTRQMLAWRASLSAQSIEDKRRELGLTHGPVGVFVGSMYPDKRLGFLIDAARRIRDRLPGFHLLLVGDGPERARWAQAARDEPWIRWLGPRHGEEKVALLALADALLNPGLVGLGILDAFACGVPIFTTDCGLHSPEIAYLRSERNGVMTADRIEDYVDAVCAALGERSFMEALRQGCAESAATYTLENMVARFCDGIEDCIAAPILHPRFGYAGAEA